MSVCNGVGIVAWHIFKRLRNNIRDLELRSCVKAEVAVLGSPSRISRMVSVDVKQH